MQEKSLMNLVCDSVAVAFCQSQMSEMLMKVDKKKKLKLKSSNNLTSEGICFDQLNAMAIGEIKNST
ncbi:CLUMA_CG008172, isoform A [Clunio marinus]|uniref:CLUMA_CG008172, isoform A n=1 Tax=Clunio marinus TaxID=568069 RepID=A0A1J1I2Y3_9DIPT|nr:CLUMA_CG008172, isoform A [Clunio marinus]